MTNVKRLIDLLIGNFTDPNPNLTAPTEAQFNNCMTIFMENPEMWNNQFHFEDNRLVVGEG